MGVTPSKQGLFDRLVDFIEHVRERRRQIALPHAIGAVHEEIHRIEKALEDMSTRPSRIVRRPEFIEPVTEQQKIIDLAG